MGMIDAHPAIRPRRRRRRPRTSSSATTTTRAARSSSPTRFNWLSDNARDRSARPRPPAEVRLRHARRLRLLPAPRGGRQRAALLRRHRPDVERLHAARHVRRVLAVAQRAAAPRPRDSPRADRGRLVRRRGLLGAVSHVPGDRGEEPRQPGPPRRRARGPTAGGRAAPATRSGQSSSGRRPGVLPRRGRAAVLPPGPEGRARRRFREALMFETGGNAWRQLDAWPPRRSGGQEAVPPRERHVCRSTPPPAPAGSRIRLVRQRSLEARPLHRRDHARARTRCS